MGWQILLSEDAEKDIEDIYRYIIAADGPGRADRVLAGLEETILGLAELPERGNLPKELDAVGMTEFREVHYKPYRIIYRMGGAVVVHCVLDGRRDMQSLLHRRLVR